VWRRWAAIGAKSGQLVDPGLTSEVRWTLGSGTLTRVETLTPRVPMTVRSWRLVVPTTATSAANQPGGTMMTGAGARLSVVVDAPWKTDAAIRATGNGPLGRGARGHIPLHLAYEARDLRLMPGEPVTWRLTLSPETEK
jgi:hypothetical protein